MLKSLTECLSFYDSMHGPHVEVTLNNQSDLLKGRLFKHDSKSITVKPEGKSQENKKINARDIDSLRVWFHGTVNPGGGEADGSGNEGCIQSVTYEHVFFYRSFGRRSLIALQIQPRVEIISSPK